MDNYTIKCHKQQNVYLVEIYEADNLKKTFTTEYPLIGPFKKNNQELLMFGNNYGIKTIINIETDEIYEPLHSEKYRYLSSYKISPDGNTMAMLVCYPACCGEVYKFYDFSDLSKGWPELKIKDNLMFVAITCDESSWDNSNRFSIYTRDDESLLDKVETLERKNNKMHLVEIWKSEKQKKIDEEYDHEMIEMNHIIENNVLCNQLKKELNSLQNIQTLFECFNFENPFFNVIITNYSLKDEDFPDHQKKRCCLQWNDGQQVIFKNYNHTQQKKYNSEDVHEIVSQIKKYMKIY